MARIRADYVFGTTTAALTASGTTLSSAALAGLPVVASPDVAAVTLTDGTNYEVVHVTAHADGAITATITRGEEGSTAQAWVSGADWSHGATAEDFARAEPFTPDAGRSPRLVPYGVKLRGANLVPMATNNDAWADLYAGWSTKWDTIVKPQIDTAAATGANAIRLIGDTGGVHRGVLTTAAYVAAYEQFVDYCANLGLYVYACLSSAQHWDGATKDQALAIMRPQAAMLETKPNVIAVDVVQELGLVPALWTGSTQHDFVSYLFASLREVTTLPLTCSTLADNSTSAQWSSGTTAAFDDLVDFFDFHPYYDGMTTADLAPFLAATSKPLVLGEYGADAANPARYSAAAAVSELDRVVGSFAWSIVDNTVTQQFGLYDSTFVERPTLTTIFRTVPDHEGTLSNAGHIVEDEGTTLPARARLNFIGAGVTAADDPTNDATTVTITGAGGGGGTGVLAGCRVKRVAAYSVTTSALVAIPWDGEDYDTDGFHSTTTNTTRLTIPTGLDGTYTMGGAWVPTTPPYSGERCIAIIRVNGTTDIAQTEVVASGSNSFPSPPISTDYQLAAGDYVELIYFHGAAGTPGLSPGTTHFYLRKVG